MNTLFGTSILPSIWQNVEKVEPTIRFERTTSIVHHTAHLTEDNFSLDLTVIDTPGFGDYTNNSFSYVPISSYIDEQLRLYMFQEEQPYRKELVDKRVHACLYFIKPTSKGMTPLDVESIKHISTRVNLIPVISKVDTLTLTELNDVRKAIRETFDAQNIQICEFLEDEGVRKTILKQFPYSIIGSESFVVNEEDGTSIRGRKYKWGIAQVENEKHCDFIKLRDLLMTNNMVDLISSTESYYEGCRTRLTKTRIKEAKENLSEDQSIKDLDYDDPDKNGLNNFKILSRFNKPYVDALVIEWSPIFLQRQLVQKKIFADVVQLEEKKFKQWKKALFLKQTAFNDEIEDLHGQIRALNMTIELLRSTKSNKKHANEENSDEKDNISDIEVSKHSINVDNEVQE